MLGSMNEMELPVFVLINVVQKAYSKSNAPLFERLKDAHPSKGEGVCEAHERTKRAEAV